MIDEELDISLTESSEPRIMSKKKEVNSMANAHSAILETHLNIDLDMSNYRRLSQPPDNYFATLNTHVIERNRSTAIAKLDDSFE